MEAWFILIDKEKSKERMREFIIDCYWTEDKPAQFKDIKEKFRHLSDGTISNYLDEIIDEKKIRKYRNENKTYYGPPKIHPAIKFCIIITIICIVISIPLSILHHVIMPVVFFNAGVIFTSIFWRFSVAKIESLK